MWAELSFNIDGRGHIFYVGVCIIHRSPSKFNGRGHSDTSLGSALAPLSWASYEATRSSREFPDTTESQQRGEKAQKKGTLLPFPPPSLVPGPYLAGGVCSQCFVEGQNSQSPDCRSCYSPGDRSEFLLPTQDIEKKERSHWLQHHTFPSLFKSFNSRTTCHRLMQPKTHLP